MDEEGLEAMGWDGMGLDWMRCFFLLRIWGGIWCCRVPYCLIGDVFPLFSSSFFHSSLLFSQSINRVKEGGGEDTVALRQCTGNGNMNCNLMCERFRSLIAVYCIISWDMHTVLYPGNKERATWSAILEEYHTDNSMALSFPNA